MKLFIHLGCHKTATTSFQKSCRKNYALLIKNGILYPKNNHFHHNQIIHNYQKKGEVVLINFFSETFTVAQKTHCHATLISGEDFENCIVDLALALEIENSARRSGYEEIHWIVVERDKKTYIDALYSELSKHQVVLNYGQLAAAAIETGCFYLSTKRLNNIFVFDIQKFAVSFQKVCSGRLHRIPFSQFIAGICGEVLLREILIGLPVNEFFLNYQQSTSEENTRLNSYHVELNYLLNLLNINIKKNSTLWFVLLTILFPVIMLRIKNKKYWRRTILH